MLSHSPESFKRLTSIPIFCASSCCFCKFCILLCPALSEESDRCKKNKKNIVLAAFVCYCSRSVYLHSPALCQNSNFLNYFRLCLCFRGDYITSSLTENSRQFHCEISTSYKCVIPSKPLLYSLLYLIIYHLRCFCHNLKKVQPPPVCA